MRILVTGGAGFIGSHLVDRLLGDGHEVVVADNLFTGSKDNLAHLSSRPGFTFIEQDIVNPLYLDDKIDQIYNLACPASPPHYQKNPVHTIKACTIGVMNMLGLARKHNARILQASTSEVYGDPEVHPQPEEYRGNVNPIGPRACYDESKRVAEALFFDYRRTHGMEIKVARIFNTYGPRMALDDGRVVSNFIVQALRGGPLTVYGDGSQTRSFCYVDDLLDGLVALMASAADFIGPVNLGNPEERTVAELALEAITLTDSKSKIVRRDLPLDDPARRCPDIGLAREKLGFLPKVKLTVGLERTIKDFRRRLD